MGKIKDLLFKRTPPSPEALEQRRKEKEAYQTEYNKARIEQARRRGRMQAKQKAGGHGIMSTLQTIDRGFQVAGNYGLQMQNNLDGLFSMGEPRKRRKRR